MTGDADRDGPGGDTPATGDKDDRPELDIDTAFAALVAQFSLPTTEGAHAWPASEDLDPDDLRTRAADAPDANPRLRSGPNRRSDLTPEARADRSERTDRDERADRIQSGERPDPVDGDDLGFAVRGGGPAAGAGPADLGYPRELDDHYVPPEPPPLPRGDLVSRLAWAGVIGGPLFLLFAAIVGGDLPAMMLLAALGAFIGGFVTLVARMPGEPPEDNDDGAVV